MGQRKHGEHTQAVLYKILAQQRTKKGTNTCLIISPLILCGLLFGLQLAINYLFLDRPEFKCGCRCVDCCISTGPNGQEECFQNDPDRCLVADRCTRKDESQCSIEYSTPQQFGFCEITTPYRWPSQLQLPQTLFENPANWEPETRDIKARTLVTGQTPAKDELMARLVDQRQTEPLIFELLSNATHALQQGANQYHSNFEDSNFLTYMLFQNPQILEAMTRADLVYGTPHHNDRPVSFFDGAFQSPDMILYLQQNCSAIATNSDELSHCAELVLQETLTRTEMSERQYYGFEKATVTQEVACIDKGYPMTDFGAAWDFGQTTKTKFDLTVGYNDTRLRRDARDQGPDWQNRATEKINMATQAFVKWVLGDEHFVKLRALRDMPREKSGFSLDFASLLGPAFYVLLFQIPAPGMLVTLVQEKENKILTRMKMQGMSPLAHYVGTYLWNLFLYCLFTIITLIAGIAVYELKFFVLSDVGLLLVFILLYGNLQITCVFLLAHVFKKSKSASVTTNLWLMLSGYLCGTLFSPLIAKDRWYMIIVEFIPTLGLFRGLYEFAEYAFLGAYTGKGGLDWSKLGDSKNGMSDVLLIFFFEWLILLVAGIIMHDESYYKAVINFGRSGGKRAQKFVEMSDMTGKVEPSSVDVEVQAEDVAEERQKVKKLIQKENKGPVLASNLRKVFKVGGTKKVACNGVDLGVMDGECIGLLGPNGADKTTLINMLVGFLDPTEGEAFINNYNIRHDKAKIFESLGVCPQFDVLWPELTSHQHLLFYGRIKGLWGAALKEAVDQALNSVNLFNVRHNKASSYSGGMKMRLSVAISLIGRPKVVFLDEPTTGLDPASRRELWETINKSREHASVVLTTHSMEEAQALCDRVGIFINGQMRCIGTPANLTTRFGEYVLLTTCKTTAIGEDQVRAFVKDNLAASGKEVYSFNGIQKFELPLGDVEYNRIFGMMKQAQDSGMVTDWGVSSASLEDVFLKVAAEYMELA